MVLQVARPLVTLVDDDTEHLFLIERALAKAEIPLEVMPFAKADEAQEFLEGLALSSGGIPKNSVLLTDIRMPGINGFDLVQRVRTHDRLNTMRIFFITASNETPDRERAKTLKVDGYCVKFPTPDVLRRIVENNGPIATCDV